MSYQHLKFDVVDGVGTVTLSRPEKLNALTYDSYREFEQLTRDLPKNADVRALVVRGEGKAFCAGGDVDKIIGDLVARDMKDHLEFARMTGALVANLREAPQPVIAAVRGTAAGAGSVIALAADVRVLSENAKFAFLFTKVGLSGGDMGAGWLLPRVVGLGRASELLLLGDTIDAAECHRIGLANLVVPDADLDGEVARMARRFADGPSYAQAMTKQMIQRELDMDFTAAIEGEAQSQALLLMGKDHAEFLAAWRAKRPPKWSGR
jgi:enoyl-CoA hydratase/carnithine racemase